MTKKNNKPGLAERVSGRLERGELRHQSMASGQGVFRGELATRALEAVGARAMTLDRSIIVGEDFDPGRPTDQALYAHERYHAEHGDGKVVVLARTSETPRKSLHGQSKCSHSIWQPLEPPISGKASLIPAQARRPIDMPR